MKKREKFNPKGRRLKTKMQPSNLKALTKREQGATGMLKKVFFWSNTEGRETRAKETKSKS